MYQENYFYGHGHLLLDAAGLPQHHTLPHRIQHGWRVDAGFAPYVFKEPGPKIVWGQRTLDKAQEEGVKHQLTAIGAPFLYLPALKETLTPIEKSLLVLPFHGWEEGQLESGFKSYAQALADFASTQDFTQITVCLYWLEYEKPEMRAPFEAHGFRVVTMGHRDHNPDFLHQQRRLILNHSVMTSNRVSTATFYALYLNRPFFLWGPPQGLSGKNDSSGEEYDRWQRAHFPQLTWDNFQGETHQDLANRELGLEYKKDGIELQNALWIGSQNRWKRQRIYMQRLGYGIQKRVQKTLFRS